ncbi:hypothetical protein PRIPAC_89432 [Pristionchus pacificus]|uniref:Uncharacterized protein n=1 Tax=Pristionchus pacificus TaxID=54126 RepID=A0A2A6B8X2_PRIPA|nr:hypothetical protein PRIPAC_89432 [Pristionchus pacificus]|eukprot:PDM62329.1 hypothetical protein PRIPAC_51771 [Pristionchus pacificus]
MSVFERFTRSSIRISIMASALLLVLFIAFFVNVTALKCNLEATISQDIKEGAIEIEADVKIDRIEITCGAGLDKCGNFNKMTIDDFLKLDAAEHTKDIALKDGKIVGSTCMSSADCTKIGSLINFGTIHTTIEHEINEGSVVCAAGLDRCAKFAKTNITDFDTSTLGTNVTEGLIVRVIVHDASELRQYQCEQPAKSIARTCPMAVLAAARQAIAMAMRAGALPLVGMMVMAAAKLLL